MDANKLYKRLKNGKRVEIFYRKPNFIDYTIWLTFKNVSFTLHCFHFDGNDVFDDSNYQDEQIENFEDFHLFVNRVTEKFPGVTYP